jgi:hypothetical protein
MRRLGLGAAPIIIVMCGVLAGVAACGYASPCSGCHPPLVLCGTTLEGSGFGEVFYVTVAPSAPTWDDMNGNGRVDLFVGISCDKGSHVTWSPLSAARLAVAAPAKDGLLAAVSLQPTGQDATFTVTATRDGKLVGKVKVIDVATATPAVSLPRDSRGNSAHSRRTAPWRRPEQDFHDREDFHTPASSKPFAIMKTNGPWHPSPLTGPGVHGSRRQVGGGERTGGEAQARPGGAGRAGERTGREAQAGPGSADRAGKREAVSRAGAGSPGRGRWSGTRAGGRPWPGGRLRAARA